MSKVDPDLHVRDVWIDGKDPIFTYATTHITTLRVLRDDPLPY